jgi:transposase
MNRIAVFVGVDYHCRVLQVCIENAAGEVLSTGRCRNDCREMVERITRLGEAYEVRGVAIEVSCGAADFVEELIERTGWMVNLAHPGYVNRMRQNPDKSDWSDARLLSDLERVGYLPKVWLAPQSVRELRRLVRYRQQLVEERRDVKLRIGALLREHRLEMPKCGRWSLAWVAWVERVSLPDHSRWVMDRHLERLSALNGALRLAEGRLGSATARDSVIERLLTLPGIGPVTAWMLRAEIGWFERFRSGKQLARFCGLSPRNASSGERQADAGLVKAGNNQLRATLLEAAHRLMRYEPRWSGLGNRLLRRGKPWNVVAAAVANRWIRWLYHQMTAPRRAA